MDSGHPKGAFLRKAIVEAGLLLALALVVRAGVAVLFPSPGYMDAYYYYDVALGLYRGEGMVEHFVWNYLDAPARIPHPAFLYWMPGPSLLVWLAFVALGPSFRAAQVPFVILSALLAPLTYLLTLELSRRVGTPPDADAALVAGLLAVFSGFYVPYWAAPDGFAPFALLGSLCLWLWGRLAEKPEPLPALGAGALAGLAHLTRSDGFLLLSPLALMLLSRSFRRRRLFACGVALAAYGTVMAPWLVRNFAVTGSPMPSWGAKTAFLTDYDDLFSWGKELSLRSYLAWGAGNIVKSKLWAAWLNLQTVVAVFLMVFLMPLFILGARKLRREVFLRPFWLYAAVLWGVMTLVFTFPGPRGSLFHSGGALLPFAFALSAVGLREATRRWAERRSLPHRALWRMNVVAALALALLVSGFSLSRALGPEGWARKYEFYAEAGALLRELSPASALPMVGNPPAFYYHARMPSIVVPNAGPEGVLRVAERYGATHLLLEKDHPRPLDALYRGEERPPAFRLVGRIGGALLFALGD